MFEHRKLFCVCSRIVLILPHILWTTQYISCDVTYCVTIGPMFTATMMQSGFYQLYNFFHEILSRWNICLHKYHYSQVMHFFIYECLIWILYMKVTYDCYIWLLPVYMIVISWWLRHIMDMSTQCWWELRYYVVKLTQDVDVVTIYNVIVAIG